MAHACAIGKHYGRLHQCICYWLHFLSAIVRTRCPELWPFTPMYLLLVALPIGHSPDSMSGTMAVYCEFIRNLRKVYFCALKSCLGYIYLSQFFELATSALFNIISNCANGSAVTQFI